MNDEQIPTIVVPSNEQIPTVTLNDVVVIFRSLGIPTSSKTIGDGIEQGKYPFGICIRTEKGRRFEIYKRLLDEWITARVS